MEKSRLETKVGLFVFVGLALLAVLMIQFSKGTSLFRGTYTLKLHTDNVGGLKPQSAVLLAGVVPVRLAFTRPIISLSPLANGRNIETSKS